MNKQIGSDLRTLFVIQALATGIIGVLAMIYPSFVIRISGVDPNSIPVMQQTGGLSVGYAVAALLALRATSWEQVRVFVAAGITANLMSLIGAVYYIFFIGVVSTGLIVLLAVYVVLSLGFVYAWRKYDRAGMAEPMAGGSITSA
ncbi:MAG: hypothetical protein KBG73_01765 [Candidatus Promineofilum sp.]|nr:hypothetical protein [Promineifilum sp.]